MRHCPYNEVDDNATEWRKTAAGADGYPWRNLNGSVGSYGASVASEGGHSPTSVGAAVDAEETTLPHHELVVLLVALALLVVGSMVVMRTR
jgi:hypothetical protein